MNSSYYIHLYCFVVENVFFSYLNFLIILNLIFLEKNEIEWEEIPPVPWSIKRLKGLWPFLFKLFLKSCFKKVAASFLKKNPVLGITTVAMKYELLKWKACKMSFETRLKIEFLPPNNSSKNAWENLCLYVYFNSLS